ncbi:MAG TPA: hypothetical protein VJV03_19840 [Pyrinomonadaceae bacterium]|nr:hypothetical protein [Pyrinomonadaceae bacterium]
MSTNRSNDIVTVSDWNACYNSSDNLLVVSCTVASAEASNTITGFGLIVNDSAGTMLASFYSGLSEGSEHVYPAFNLPPGHLNVDEAVLVVVQGECDGQHFFVEQELTIGHC